MFSHAHTHYLQVVMAHNDLLFILGIRKNKKHIPFTDVHLCSFTLQVTAIANALTHYI